MDMKLTHRRKHQVGLPFLPGRRKFPPTHARYRDEDKTLSGRGRVKPERRNGQQRQHRATHREGFGSKTGGHAGIIL